MMKIKHVLGTGIVALTVLACAVNPITGRSSIQLVSNSELAASALQEYNQVLSESKVIKGTADAQKVTNVGIRIKAAAEKYYANIGRQADLQNYQWEYNLLQDPQLNAWCMPGGKIAFYSGIMPVCEDETGVAVVMGHEVSHALAGHSNERVSQAMIAQGLGQIAGMAIKKEALARVFQSVYPIGAQTAILAYSRKQELEADEMGLYLMAMAGYNPTEAVDFWNRMEVKSQSGNTPEFLSTHPNPDHRRADLNVHMPKALEYYRAAGGK